MRPRMILIAALVTVLLGTVLLVPAAIARIREERASGGAAPGAPGSSSASPAPSGLPPLPASPEPTLAARPVNVSVPGFFSWALLDRRTGQINGSPNITETNSTESMIKIWIVSDYLRRAADADQTPTATRLRQASDAIRHSDDDAAQSLYVAGGRDAVVRRMISTCELTETRIARPGWWSYTRISARDAARMGVCVADGRAAGRQWTTWVFTEMTKVTGTTSPADQQLTRGGGRWGIIDGLPRQVVARGVGIKNGWTLINADGLWHLNCLAVAADWSLAVLMRYPGSRGLAYGAGVCKSVAQQLVVTAPARPSAPS